jgi:hypothetical protein
VIGGANGLPAARYLPIAEVALMVARLPCTEADVERVLSSLYLVLGGRRGSVQDALIEALLLIRLHDIPNDPPGDGDAPHDECRGGPLSRGVVAPRRRLPNPNKNQHGRGGALKLRIAAQRPRCPHPSWSKTSRAIVCVLRWWRATA